MKHILMRIRHALVGFAFSTLFTLAFFLIASEWLWLPESISSFIMRGINYLIYFDFIGLLVCSGVCESFGAVLHLFLFIPSFSILTFVIGTVIEGSLKKRHIHTATQKAIWVNIAITFLFTLGGGWLFGLF